MTGSALWIPGNQPIPFSREMGPAVLVSGSAVVFAVDCETGERRHLFSVEPGEPLLPLGSAHGSSWEIVAFPLEASCIEPIGDLREWAGIIAVESCVAKIGGLLATLEPPREWQLVESGRTLRLAPGQRAGIEEGVAFVEVEGGAASVSGAPAGVGVRVALVPGLWIEAAGELTLRTEELSGPAASSVLLATLDLIVPAFLRALDRSKMEQRAEEARRFAERHRINGRASAEALEELAAVSTAARRTHAPTAPSGEPLFQAVNAAAAAMGVTARAPQEGSRRQDPLSAIALRSGLRTRMVMLAGDWWRRDNGPLVGWLREGHRPVALTPAAGGFFGGARYDLVDAAAGVRQRVNRDVAGQLEGFAQMLYRPLPEDLSTRGLLRHALASRRGDLRTIAIAGMAAAALGMAVPQGAAILIGEAIPGADTNMLWQVAAGMITAAFGAALFLLAQAVAALRAQNAGFAALQSGVWDHLLRLGPAFFRGFTAAQLRLRADAITRIHRLFTADALRSVMAGLTSLVTLALMFWYSAPLGLIALGCGLAVAGCTWMGARSLFRVQEQSQHKEELLSGLVLQAVNAVSKLRVAGAAGRAFSHWARAYSGKQKLSLQAQAIKDRLRLVNITIPTLAPALAFLYVLVHPVTLANFLAWNAALSLFLTAIASASDTLASLVLAGNLWAGISAILAASPEVDTSKTHPGRLRGRVAIENATFRYRADGPLILDGVSIAAAPGECIAITGPSGSGKSTLLNLLLRFETPQSGAIYFDGRELASLDIGEVRRQIGVVTQDGRLMAGSIFENICCGGVNTMEDAWDAARAAGLAEDIENLPMGMRTIVSEGGSNLSGGQRQRLLIARALVLKPSILIFDEATSALDNRTQAIVTASLSRLKATRILVAHRLSTIRHANRIYVIEKGRVVQQGTYAQLAAEPGLIARLVRRQRAY